MPRNPRLDLPSIPQHVVQRGNDRQPCFFVEADYPRYHNDLRECALRAGCAIHAYVLMTNHVHLLVTPVAAGCVGRLMQSLGRRYVRYVNDSYHRTDTLWEERYKAYPVDSNDYLLRCYRYIELNPVRARMVADPGEYRWSSFAANALGGHDPLAPILPTSPWAPTPRHERRRITHSSWKPSIPPSSNPADCIYSASTHSARTVSAPRSKRNSDAAQAPQESAGHERQTSLKVHSDPCFPAAPINDAMDALLKAAPGAGSYVSESDYFEREWQRSFWGSNYPKLAKVKKKYDPQGLFFVHHGVGSEAWSPDGFTRLR